MNYKIIDKVPLKKLKVGDVFIYDNELHYTIRKYEDNSMFTVSIKDQHITEWSLLSHRFVVDLTNLKMKLVGE